MSVLVEHDQAVVDHTGRELEHAVDPKPDRGPEVGRLTELERTIGEGMAAAVEGFVQAGLGLHTIRSEKLYRACAPNWSAYLHERWSISQQQASALESAARCARAITDAPDLRLPANVTVGALRPLGPVLTAGGEPAVIDAWRTVQGELSGRVTGPAVRRALAARGTPTIAPEKHKMPLEPMETSVLRALARARGLAAEHDGRVAPAAVRTRCERLAILAREIADTLDQVANVDHALKRLRAVEHPATASFGLGDSTADDAGDLCIGHGLRRDQRGVCLGCGRPDRRAAA